MIRGQRGKGCKLLYKLSATGEQHILFATFASPSVASLTADFGPSSILIQCQNTPLREHAVLLPVVKEAILAKSVSLYEKVVKL